ncbi:MULTISPECIES: PTS sugar transporter subunit IIA [unclassified Collinsella]|uniref:PTS sugar transporter subunit IIA n=1 Tax=unclassified Collinsella TaxID=2637548 RepID=UPI0011CAA57B|nr:MULTISPECIES: PTS sugar transporter subunit IIA [unclassified Collinsella]TXF38924.1 PTS sugar transporter subunit IIA [Collinsella sp. BA40]
MIGFILTGHGQFSNGLKSALDMVAGDQPAFQIVPFEGSEAATYGDDLRAAITAMRAECEEGVIVFVDLLGGTPFNQSMMIANDVDKLEIVTGTNLPMVIELLFARNGATDVTALAEQAVTAGKDAVTRQSLASVMGAADEATDEDGI